MWLSVIPRVPFGVLVVVRGYVRLVVDVDDGTSVQETPNIVGVDIIGGRWRLACRRSLLLLAVVAAARCRRLSVGACEPADGAPADFHERDDWTQPCRVDTVAVALFSR